MSTLNEELEGVCTRIKHGLELDLDEVRRTCRRAQYRIQELEELTRHGVFPGANVLRFINEQMEDW